MSSLEDSSSQMTSAPVYINEVKRPKRITSGRFVEVEFRNFLGDSANAWHANDRGSARRWLSRRSLWARRCLASSLAGMASRLAGMAGMVSCLAGPIDLIYELSRVRSEPVRVNLFGHRRLVLHEILGQHHQLWIGLDFLLHLATVLHNNKRERGGQGATRTPLLLPGQRRRVVARGRRPSVCGRWLRVAWACRGPGGSRFRPCVQWPFGARSIRECLSPSWVWQP